MFYTKKLKEVTIVFVSHNLFLTGLDLTSNHILLESL